MKNAEKNKLIAEFKPEEKLCPKCLREVEEEKDKEIDYPYVCLDCDENFYQFEIITNKK